MSEVLADQLRSLEFYFPALSESVRDRDHVYRELMDALKEIELNGLSWARLDQVMHTCSLAGMSSGFYRYYFIEIPRRHPYPVTRLFTDGFAAPKGLGAIKSFRQLEWGVLRFFVDAMLYWGNFRQAYRVLRQMPLERIEAFFERLRIDTERLASRGKVRRPENISLAHRYLISEKACKTFRSSVAVSELPHVRLLLRAHEELDDGSGCVAEEALVEKARELADPEEAATSELLRQELHGEAVTKQEILSTYSLQQEEFDSARAIALANTQTYLSFCNDLDVYVATSMRIPSEFEYTARECKGIFEDALLKEYDLRYFDPTISAATHHEDKGIIECLMVKTAKATLYFAQDRESLGKVSEYAMALSLGRPVIILCPDTPRGRVMYEFYRDAHPLTRLVQFSSGVVCGAIITCGRRDVPELLRRIFANEMEYDLAKKEGTDEYFLLKERITESTFRVVTDNRLLTETFWNNYHNVH